MASTERQTLNIKAILSQLHCVYCKGLLQAPTAVCESGHTFCSDCRPKMTTCHFNSCMSDLLCNVRNLAIEKITRLIHNKCVNYRNGCRTLLTEELKASHEKLCPYNLVECPAVHVPYCRCTWEGPRSKLMSHVLRRHSERTNKTNFFTCTTVLDNYQLMIYKKELFLYYKRFMNGLWYAVVVNVGLTQNSFKSIFTLQPFEQDSDVQLTVTLAVDKISEPLGAILSTGKCLVLDEVLVRYFIENDEMNLHISVEMV